MTKNENINILRNNPLYFGPSLEMECEEKVNWKSMWGRVLLFVNETDIIKLLHIEKETAYFSSNVKVIGSYNLPLYLYFDRVKFEQLISKTDISDLCKIYRVVWIIGKADLEKFFLRRDVIFPEYIIENSGSDIQNLIKKIYDNRTDINEKKKECLREYYTNNADLIRKRMKEGRGKILFPRYSYEPGRFQKFYELMKKEMEKIGYEIVIHKEEASVFSTNEIELLDEERPDAVFLINKCRSGEIWSGEAFEAKDFEGLYYINWLQDRMPNMMNNYFANNLQERDLIFSYFEFNYLKGYGYKYENIIDGGIQPVSEEMFRVRSLSEEEQQKYECDICMAGDVMTTERLIVHADTVLSKYLNREEVILVLEKMVDLTEDLFDSQTGDYYISEKMLCDARDDLQRKLGCSDTVAAVIFRVFFDARYMMLRRLIMKQIADTYMYKIYYYSTEDLEIPGIKYQGFLTDEEEMSKAYQAARVVMQICPNVTMSQRITEALFSGSVILANKMDAGEDVCRYERYLEEGEGVYFFKNKEELLERLDYLVNNEEERKIIARKGTKKAMETLTTQSIAKVLADGLKEHI